jgi:hypothetical protein
VPSKHEVLSLNPKPQYCQKKKKKRKRKKNVRAELEGLLRGREAEDPLFSPRFCLMVKKGYRDPPYHNWMHAFSVSHFCYLLYKNLELTNYLE